MMVHNGGGDAAVEWWNEVMMMDGVYGRLLWRCVWAVVVVVPFGG